ncbi:SHOCT domain-containing protein [Nitrospiraceae bacterium AH_259_D15_M11_P09]|nr:SHOCT domain-containing protein [Nitrospiraceae bacterium AH_259_D15_M11_P09]
MILATVVVSCTSLSPETPSISGDLPGEITVVEVEADEPLLYASLLNHPHAFDAGALEGLMRSLYFSPKGVISWGERELVFSDEEILKIAPLIREAFQQAKPFQKIQFEVHTPKGTTTGDLFIMDGELHWRFEVIQRTAHFEEFESLFRFESETSVTPNWILRPQDHQQYYSLEWVLGIKREAKNWLVIAIDEEEAPALALPKQGSERKSLTQRLRLLQELKTDGLITEGDYEKKVRALLAEVEHDEIPASERLLFLKQLRDEGVISGVEYERRKQEVLDQI